MSAISLPERLVLVLKRSARRLGIVDLPFGCGLFGSHGPRRFWTTSRIPLGPLQPVTQFTPLVGVVFRLIGVLVRSLLVEGV